MAEATSTGTSFTLTEEGGGTLTLTGRALPYLPLSITGKQRAEFTWYPGSPSATVQMLGPEEGAITIRGYWKDKFLAGSTDATYGKTGISFKLGESLRGTMNAKSILSSSTLGIQTCTDLVQVVDTMRRMGRRITLAWGSIIRIGHITSFTQTWYTPGYCEWEMEFSVAAQEAGRVQAVSSAPAVTLDAFTVDIAGQAQNVIVASEGMRGAAYRSFKSANFAGVAVNGTLPPTILTATIVDKLGQIEAQVQGFVDILNNGLQQITSVINQVNQVLNWPADITRKTLGTLRQSTESIANSLGAVENTAISYWAAYQEVFGGQDAVPLGLQMGAMSAKRGWTDFVHNLIRSSTTASFLVEQQLQQNEVSQYYAPRNMDMRDISQQAYGTPNYWQQLMIYNGRTSSAVPAGTLIYVPNDPSYFGAGLPVGGTN